MLCVISDNPFSTSSGSPWAIKGLNSLTPKGGGGDGDGGDGDGGDGDRGGGEGGKGTEVAARVELGKAAVMAEVTGRAAAGEAMVREAAAAGKAGAEAGESAWVPRVALGWAAS